LACRYPLLRGTLPRTPERPAAPRRILCDWPSHMTLPSNSPTTNFTSAHDKQIIDNLRTHYRSGHDDLRRDFFLPCLSHAVTYRRAAGYFSSSALLSWSSALPDIIEQPNKKIELLISPELSESDLTALRKVSTDEDRRAVQQHLADAIVRDATDFALAPSNAALRLRVFIWLVASARLEIRFAFPEHITNARLYHEKIGLFVFPWGSTVAFTGSANETEGGHSDNYESIDVFRDWIAADSERVAVKQSQFDLAWNGLAPGLKIRTLSPETMEYIRERASDYPRPSHATQNPHTPENDIWRHQDEAIEAFLRNERGVLEMATGTGKTRTTLRILERLFRSEHAKTAIIATDGNDLLDQWHKQLTVLSHSLHHPIAVLRNYSTHKEHEPFLLNPSGMILLTSRQFLRPALKALTKQHALETLLIHDEVHGLGSPGNQRDLAGLSDAIRFRLGLSATPEREYDTEGTAFIEKHIGPTVYRFGLEEAITRGVLSPFDYHPIEWQPSPQDKERLKGVHRQAAARAAAGNPMTQAEIWIALANVYKSSHAKLPLLENLLNARPDLLNRSIVFVPTRDYGGHVIDIIHRHRHDFHPYYADDAPATLQRFASGALECLVTCHRLSEGIDIQSLRTVILLSSDRTRLETIQRMGRCLRRDPTNPAKRAQVVDFVRTSESDTRIEPTPDEERRDWLTRLSRIRTQPPP
jgi:superfamily II DNA or RNA helicase